MEDPSVDRAELPPAHAAEPGESTSAAATAFVVGTAAFVVCFTLGAVKPIVESLVALLLAVAVLGAVCVGLWSWFGSADKRRAFRQHMATLHLQSTWAGAHLGFPLTQLRGSAFVLAALFIVSGLILFGVSFLLGTPQGAAGATVVLAVAAIVVGFFWTGLDRSWFPALARAQIAVAFDYLGEEETADATNEGVAMWVFHVGPILDGGTGLALDPTHRMSDAEFADEAWSFATYDPTECEHLVDEWYWCW